MAYVYILDNVHKILYNQILDIAKCHTLLEKLKTEKLQLPW